MSLIQKVIQRVIKKLYQLLPISYFVKKIGQKRGVVFFMYHSTPLKTTGYGYITPKEQFEKQMEFLKKYFEVVPVNVAYEILYENKKHDTNKPIVVITFDDGYRDNYEVAYPILKDYNFPFTIFLTTDFILNDNQTFMSWDEVEKLNDELLATLGAHSKSHASLKALVDSDKKAEIIESKDIIQDKINQKVKYFAYPGGGHDDVCLKTVEENYTLGFKDRTNGDNDLDKRKVARVSIDSKHNDFKNFLIELAGVKYLETENEQ
ncbi:MAG: polysaccharide deacetylase family protein [Campylobacterota bacterium]